MTTEEGRNCTKCGDFKSWSEFSKNKRNSSGHTSRCKSCDHEYYKANKDKISQREAAYYENNKEKVRTRAANYYAINKDNIRKQHAKWHDSNRDSVSKRKASDRKANKEKYRERSRNYYQNKKEEILKSQSEYYRDNADILKAKRSRRRARILGAISDVGLNIPTLRKIHGDYCYFCGVLLVFEGWNQSAIDPKYATHEHLIPLSRGGNNTFDNSALSCISCNKRKHTKTAEEFMKILEKEALQND